MSAADLISKGTRNAFREELVGWTLAETTTEFDNEGFSPDHTYDLQVSRQRRSLVEQLYHGIDFADPRQASRVRVDRSPPGWAAHSPTRAVPSDGSARWNGSAVCPGRSGSLGHAVAVSRMAGRISLVRGRRVGRIFGRAKLRTLGVWSPMMLSRPLAKPPMEAANEGPWASNDCVHLRSVKTQQMGAEI